MSDYLARLVARTLGHAPAVRPHLVPLYGDPARSEIVPADDGPEPDAARIRLDRPTVVIDATREARETPALTERREPARAGRPQAPDDSLVAATDKSRRATSSIEGEGRDATPAEAEDLIALPALRLAAPRHDRHVAAELPVRRLIEPTPPVPASARSHISGVRGLRGSDEPMQRMPTVRVTIGRVDVRAVQSPSAPTRRQPDGPRLTLEDYAQQRRDGRR